MSPGLQIGQFRVHYYGLILALAIGAAYWLVRHRTKKAGYDTNLLDQIVIWAVPLGIIGARIYYIAFTWQRYVENPIKALYIWEGGIAIHGAILGGLVGLLLALWFYKRKNIKSTTSLLMWLDILMPGVMLGQIIGRFGNFVNQEAFGTPTSLPWGIAIDPNKRPQEFANDTHFHPTFAYEALWNSIGLILIFWLEKKLKIKPGYTLGLYLLWYSVGRYFVEALRTDSLYAGSVRVAQIVSVLSAVGGALLIWYAKPTWKKSRSTQ